MLVGEKVAVLVAAMVQWVAQIDLEHMKDNQREYCSAWMRREQMREHMWQGG